MSRVFVVFRKDGLHLWPHIAAFVASLAVFAALDPTYHDTRPSFWAQALPYLLPPLACWNLVIGAVHQETLIGHNQYWLTRPFTWRDLLAAKVLFILTFVNLPVFVCQAAVLAANGFSPIEYLSFLLWKQVFFSVFLVLPAMALAAVTKNLARAFLTAILAFVFLYVLAGLVVLLYAGIYVVGFGLGPGWIVASVAALTTLAGLSSVLLFQYTRRRSALSRSILAFTTLLALLGPPLMLPRQVWITVERWRSKQKIASSAVRLLLGSASDLEAVPNPGGMRIPVRVEGVPPGLEVAGSILGSTVEGQGVTRLGMALQVSAGKGWLKLYKDSTSSDRLTDVPLRLHGSVYITLFRRLQTLRRADLFSAPVRDVGICWADAFSSQWCSCLSVFPRAALIGADRLNYGNSMPIEDAARPFPVSPWFGPLTKYRFPILQPLAADDELELAKPVAHIVRTFDFTGVRLSDYQTAGH